MATFDQQGTITLYLFQQPKSRCLVQQLKLGASKMSASGNRKEEAFIFSGVCKRRLLLPTAIYYKMETDAVQLSPDVLFSSPP
jgi:hypothetical protein